MLGMLFGETPKDRIRHTELKKLAKHFDLSEREQHDFLSHFDEHKRNHYSKDNIHEIIRKGRAKSGDSLSSTHWDRIERKLHEHIDSRIRPMEPSRELKAGPKMENPRAYRTLPDRIDVPETPKPFETSFGHEREEKRLENLDRPNRQ
jgi:hypothetical protein